MQLWLISDTHFGHHNMYTFEMEDGTRVRDKFRDAHEGDAYMCEKWCDLVKPSDHIYHLGDVTMERSSNAKTWFVNKIRSLPGHKRLILGNHDHLTMDVYRDAGFEKIKGSHKINGLLLSHYPLHPSTLPVWCHSNAHGHIHRNRTPEGRYVNMCVEVRGYMPTPIEEVEAEAKKLWEVWKESKEGQRAVEESRS